MFASSGAEIIIPRVSIISEILDHNATFVQRREYEPYLTDRFPDKKLVVVTCMDARLVELLPMAMNVRQGDVKLIKNAGAIVSHPFGSVMRSILVAVYELNAAEVAIVGHHQCGMTGLSCARILDKARLRGVSEDTLATLANAGVNLDKFLHGFETVQEGVLASVNIVRNHPLLPKDVPVHGMIIDPATGKLDLLTDGYKHQPASER